jgi:CPA1 family monovalent cation:H+ antiporter
MVMFIPDDLSLPNWNYDFSIKEFITAITIGSIYFTLIIKATTIGKVIRWLKIDELLPHEKMSYFKSQALIYQSLKEKIRQLLEHKDISEPQYQSLITQYHDLYQQVCQQCQEKNKDPSHVAQNMLLLYTLAKQKSELKELFRRDEINEGIYKRNLAILETQTERVEQDKPQIGSLNDYFDNWINKFNHILHRLLFLPDNISKTQEHYLYYRTQNKLITKALEELVLIKNSALIEIFDDPTALENATNIYQQLKNKNIRQMKHELLSNKALLDDLNLQSAEALLNITKIDTLKELHANEIISSKLFILLKQEIDKA